MKTAPDLVFTLKAVEQELNKHYDRLNDMPTQRDSINLALYMVSEAIEHLELMQTNEIEELMSIYSPEELLISYLNIVPGQPIVNWFGFICHTDKIEAARFLEETYDIDLACDHCKEKYAEQLTACLSKVHYRCYREHIENCAFCGVE